MIYVEETIKITAAILDFDGVTYLEDTDGITVTAQFFDADGDVAEFNDAPDGNVVPQPVDMTIDDSGEHHVWFYDWTPFDVPAGTYFARIVATSEDGFRGVEYQRITLREAPFHDDSNC